ncbi:159L [Invertebrate iridescent virus Kaz2018]|uniref:Uncharacterized protein 159L n=1 Tax=Invertebrate iridescent virus 6 TaxID=176652 RepID=159L_IIV6|nr:159L [Invertebrate iridescent virus 6]O55757.1 RecName: Full=Uncharacterized protein 159L [Invertebrate iridescent virus 6]AAB94468.1 159L [Invertebrate iridescent virus 6]QMS79312.1 hypothetical protein IIV6-T1_159 [Invertebrate iridescent virus 6]QNH08569.1 159L [Invertebrate iridescent virus Kaz2018]
METETNFKIYNPLQQLEQGSIGGGSGSIPAGSVTGGAGGSIANATITNINIAAGTITGGSGGNIAAGTITGGSGGNIAPNTITAGELAAGAAAANINSGPAGAVNGSKVSKADNTNFGVIEFDPSGDLTQTAAGSGIAVLKTGAAAANINAGPAGAINSSQIAGGPFLSSSPGSVTGGPGGNIAAGTVTGGSGGDLAAGTVTGGAGGNIAAGTVTGGAGGNIAANTITAGELAAGAAAANINSGPAGAVNGSQISKADNTNFGVIEFDPSGDLKQTAAGSGIALVKQPAAGTSVTIAGFDSSGTFITSKVGSIVAAAVPNGTSLNFYNIMIRYPTVAPISLQISVAAVGAAPPPGPGFIGIGEQRWIVNTTINPNPPPPANPNPGTTPYLRTESRVTQNSVAVGTFSYLNVNNVATGAISALATPWDNSEQTVQGGAYERYEFYINDGVDASGYRVTAFYFSPSSFITIERLQGN